MNEALVQLRIPQALKGRWVRESRAAGQKLTDWIVSRVEEPLIIVIPAELKFSDLKLARESDGSVSYSTGVIARIAVASGLPPDYFEHHPEDAMATVITQWYRTHRATGGAPDPVQEDLIGESRAEDARGGGLSHQPGQA